jgi:ATP-dependent protease ClpP protease subunit
MEERRATMHTRTAEVRARWIDARERLSPVEKENELLIYDVIGEDWLSGRGILPVDVRDWLGERGGEDVTVRINSPGGSVFDGNAIHNALKHHDGEVTIIVDGIAASIASVVAMAGDLIVMEPNAMMMIHDPHSFVWGTAEDMRREADTLETVKDTLLTTYSARTGKSGKVISDMMAAATWLTAADCLAKGFCDRVGEPMTAPEPAGLAARVDEPGAAEAAAKATAATAATAARLNTLRLRLAIKRRAIEAA